MTGRLTPGVVLAGLTIGTAYGPLAVLRDTTPDQLADGGFWLEVGAAAVRSFAGTALALGGLIAAALGLPMLTERRLQQAASTGAEDERA
jgi:ABC-type nitrate/sulfonate/bicarbonate transport system permease component